MKTLIWLSILSIMALVVFSQAVRTPASYTVHEWGTFTSLQGGDGKLLSWRPLQTSELPGFVYNWNRPGMGRSSATVPVGIKSSMVTLQRLETPVIYFYSGEKMKVDISVGFPKGLITEWYPQASQIGPATIFDTNTAPAAALRDSRAVWKDLEITPASNDQSGLSGHLPQDQSGSHYFAARKTGADIVQTDLPGPSDSQTEFEKFIFYRGAGSFETPLRASVNGQGDVTVENTGAEKLAHLFFVSIHNGHAAFAVMDELPPGNPVSWLNLNGPASKKWQVFPLPEFHEKIGMQLESALVNEGLFADEARAMINTWKDSWLTESGERVLYILPRKWTDKILPMTLNPPPRNLARVMVGRAEIITPAAVTGLVQDLSKAQSGEATARNQAIMDLKAFGRFAWPALSLASLQGASTKEMNLGVQLFVDSIQTRPKN